MFNSSLFNKDLILNCTLHVSLIQEVLSKSEVGYCLLKKNKQIMEVRPKQGYMYKPLKVRGYKTNMIKHGNNSGVLESGIDIPLKTVQIVGL